MTSPFRVSDALTFIALALVLVTGVVACSTEEPAPESDVMDVTDDDGDATASTDTAGPSDGSDADPDGGDPCEGLTYDDAPGTPCYIEDMFCDLGPTQCTDADVTGSVWCYCAWADGGGSWSCGEVC